MYGLPSMVLNGTGRETKHDGRYGYAQVIQRARPRLTLFWDAQTGTYEVLALRRTVYCLSRWPQPDGQWIGDALEAAGRG